MNTEVRYDILDIATEEQQEAIKQIDALNIGALQRAYLILIELGVKPASEISVSPWNDGVEKVETIMRNAKLQFQETGREKVEEGEHVSYAVAKDAETLARLVGLDPSKDHAEYGRLMGFPATAVEVFGTEDVLEEAELPEAERARFEGVWNSFKMSRDHWQAEFKLMKYWSKLLDKYAPNTLAGIMPSQKNK